MFVFVVDGYKKQYKKWQHTDGYGGRQSFDPQHGVGGLRPGMTVAVVVVVTVAMTVVVVVMVIVVVVMSVARTQFRQSQKNERERHRPANVP